MRVAAVLLLARLLLADCGAGKTVTTTVTSPATRTVTQTMAQPGPLSQTEQRRSPHSSVARRRRS